MTTNNIPAAASTFAINPSAQEVRDADTVFAMLRLVGAASTDRLVAASCMPRVRVLAALRLLGAESTPAELWILSEDDMYGAPGH